MSRAGHLVTACDARHNPLIGGGCTGLAMLAYTGNTPDWALLPNQTGLGYRFPPLPEYTADFERWVTALATRYQGQVMHLKKIPRPLVARHGRVQSFIFACSSYPTSRCPRVWFVALSQLWGYIIDGIRHSLTPMMSGGDARVLE